MSVYLLNHFKISRTCYVDSHKQKIRALYKHDKIYKNIQILNLNIWFKKNVMKCLESDLSTIK